MSNYSRHEKRSLTSTRGWPYLKFGSLILLAGVTAWVLVLAVTR
ncbi:hypothetical protein [Arthrobacter sp. Y81]|nr:hypothetical protein [Arthrobacter sp. Y81]